MSDAGVGVPPSPGKNQSTEWGRIDADGTVFVNTADGEREIGSWQAGDAEAGLAFYVRRYESLETDVTLLEQRLASGAGDATTTRTQAKELIEKLPTFAGIGDLASIDTRLQALLTAADAKAGEDAAAKQQARADAIAVKEALAVEAEQIAESSTSWKVSGDRLKAILDEWKLVKGIDRKTDEALWKRFAAARDAFSKRRGQHFSQLDAERGTARSIKQKLVERAEELAASTDWKTTATSMRDLMNEWKAAPRAAREVEDALWTKFRAAQDGFFSKRSEVFSERDAEQTVNAEKKQALIGEAEAIDLSNAKAAQSKLRDIQSRFDEIGHVPRDAMRRIDDRMRAAEQRVRDAVDTEWRRGSADSNPFMAALKQRLAEAEVKLEKAKAAGDAARIKKAEEEVASRKALLPE
ncbi:MAG TPA: DUF349 domain-containing protein [Jatrophihabitans sp.]|jgi:hypothetical protein